uniref:Serine/threonine-protein kinase gad8 n=1 Tax=Lygus hesperus TaxID=30085 RepID=A0A146LYE2_LYGHE
MLVGLPPFFNTNIRVMYEKIIRAELTFPAFISKNAESLLRGMLERDPGKRLGSGSGDAKEIKQHPFFHSIDWDKLLRKEISPPFKPSNANDPQGTTNVDEAFTKEFLKDTPVQPSHLKQRVYFPDFTYMAPESVPAAHGK